MKQITTPLILLLCLAPCVVSGATKAQPRPQPQAVITAEMLEKAFEITPEKPVGDLKILADALATGADINKPVKLIWAELSPLYLAIIEKNPGAAKFLIEHGADVNRPEVRIEREFKSTAYPLIDAIISLKDGGSREIVTYLLDHKANVNVIGGAVNIKDPEEGFGMTPLGAAMMGGQEDIALVLLQHGADQQKLFATYKKDLLAGGPRGHWGILMTQPIMQLAAYGLMPKLLTELFNRKVPLTKNRNGQTDLHLACHPKAQMEDPTASLSTEECIDRLKTVIGILLKHDSKLLNEQDANGDTALHYLTRWTWGRESIYELLAFNPDITIKNSKGETPLDLVRKRQEQAYEKTDWDAIIKKMEEMAKK